jgi:hypothetical protein
MNRRLLAVVGAGLWAALAVGAPAPKTEKPASKEWVIFLGCGEVRGEGTVVQIDQNGTVLGTVKLENTPYGLTAVPGGVAAASPSGGKVVRIDKTGKVETLIHDAAKLPHPISVTCDPATGDIYAADNRADVLLVLPKGEAKDAREVLTFPGAAVQLQNLSLAFGKGHLLYGGDVPKGVYRFKAGKDAALGDPLLNADAGVAADPTSDRWAAGSRDELRVFEENKEIAAIRYPAGRRYRHGAIAMAPEGVPILALQAGATKFEIVQADVVKKEFKVLFRHETSRVVSLAVGPKLDWK